MKVTLAQVNVHVGNFEANLSKFREAIHTAKQEGSELIIFPELAICGYPPRDFLDYKHFVQECVDAVLSLSADCVGITAIVGCPTFNPNAEGKSLHNSAYVLSNGKVQTGGKTKKTVRKTVKKTKKSGLVKTKRVSKKLTLKKKMSVKKRTTDKKKRT